MLHHMLYTQLDDQSWCVTAQIVAEREPPTFENKIKNEQQHTQKREQQRSGVRQLLQYLLDEIGINDVLDDTEFPYRLANSRYYVCFSHSKDRVAVALSKNRAIGIDIEMRDIPWHVAKRFYDDKEIAALSLLHSDKRSHICRLLWQIKESYIKIYQYKLAQGLGKDYSYLIPDLINSAQTQSSIAFIKDYKTDYTVAALSSQQTIVIF